MLIRDFPRIDSLASGVLLGTGYRDLLIWESLRRLTWSGHERIVFVTANVRYFVADARLHQELAVDVLNADRVEVFDSLRAFNEKHVMPRLETIDRLNKGLQTIAGGSPDLTAWVRYNLLEILRWEELGYAVGSVPSFVRCAANCAPDAKNCA